MKLHLLAALVAFVSAASAQQSAYDPLALPGGATPATTDLTIRDAARQRDIPIRVYLPAGADPAPVILFSHGLGGSREGSAFLGRHWAARGYAAIFLQHPGSDESVWRDAKPLQRMGAMRAAASLDNFLLRVQDVPAVLDQLERWNASAPGNPLRGRLDLSRVGMSGHSFGAATTQAVSGQEFPRRGALFADKRIRAALILSPSAPKRGDPADAFGHIALPWMLMTGTEDSSPIGDVTPASRLNVFPALPPGAKYQLVLNGAEHSVFTDRALPGDRRQRNPAHHRSILALSTAFWDAWLRHDAAAQRWLDGGGPASVLDAADRWFTK